MVKPKPKTGNCHCEDLTNDMLNMLQLHEPDASYTTPAKIMINEFALTVNVLFDTGALQGNYVNEDTAAWMRRHGAEEFNSPTRVCSAFNECVITKNSML